ncbi:MAG TPA: class I SAM-dependent methyltransferase [Anaeromyxobacteraceae bacterium]|nr:class I SAM-dependent methyltransferase [Anaeromyxobacteraceae bacterium]
MGARDDLEHNRRYWNAISSEYQREHAAQLPTDDPTWGAWGLPERELRLLGDVAGLDVLELGCGGAQWSIALARRGARCTGLDLSDAQLAFARGKVAEAGVAVALVHASADETGLPDASFDLVFCDHGAMSFTDPYRVIPEVARLLRPGGRLVFNASTPFLQLCREASSQRLGTELLGAYFGLHRVHAPGEAVEFALPYGEWIRLFRRNGFAIEDLVELCPPEAATTTYEGYAPLEWARRWPAEQVWKVVKRAEP